MASKKQTIVIKKIIVQGGGHHGGSWKVALADFMTAMMAFFLVMWLIGQSEETKKAISDYFSAPSMIEYNYENYGAEVTLEKLFLDFTNEPMKAVQSFFEPADKTPNVLDMGSSKVISAFMADKLSDIAKNMNISKDGIEFDIPDIYLFEQGTAKPKAEFVSVIDKVTSVTSGLKDSEIKLISSLFVQAVEDKTVVSAEKVAQSRLELIKNKISATFEHSTNKINGSINVKDKKGEVIIEKLIGFIHVSIKAKEMPAEAKKKKQAENDLKKPVFETFAKEAFEENDTTDGKGKKYQYGKNKKIRTAEGVEPSFNNPVEMEINKLNEESEPISK